MLQYKKIIALLSMLSLSVNLAAAPSARSVEGRTRAIDLLAEGQALENQGDSQAAYQKYYESAQLAPSPSAYYHLGRVARLSGQKDYAREWLNRALELNPKFELAKVELMQLNDGAANQGAVVKTVSGELQGDVAPGSADAMNSPMNVDALRREVLTMQSLAPPDPSGASALDQAAAATPAPATPQDIVFTGSDQPEMADNEVTDLLAPSIDPSGNNDPFTLPSLAQAGPASEPPAGPDKPTRADINEAAFGEESQKDPGSKGYGQDTKVVLGTFAFHREKGDNYRDAKRWQEAAVEYKTALELSPNDTETRTLLAEMYGRIGEMQDAQKQFAKAKAQAPADDRIYYKEGNAYFDDQKYDLAIGSYRKALDLNPSNKLALNNMGVAYMEMKNYTQATDKFKQVLKLDPNYDMAVLNLGIIYDEHIVDKEQALQYYDRYLALKGPRSTEVQRWADAIRARQVN